MFETVARTILLSLAVVIVGVTIKRNLDWKRTSGLILVAVIFAVISLLGKNLKTLKASLWPASVEMTFESAQGAAEAVIENRPEIAEKITKEKGPAAIEKAKKRVKATRNIAELKEVVPFEQVSDGYRFLSTSEGNQVSIIARPTSENEFEIFEYPIK